jgi:hypothetical protein
MVFPCYAAEPALCYGAKYTLGNGKTRNLETTTTKSTQAIPVKSGMERVFKRYYFASGNHNRS